MEYELYNYGLDDWKCNTIATAAPAAAAAVGAIEVSFFPKFELLELRAQCSV